MATSKERRDQRKVEKERFWLFILLLFGSGLWLLNLPDHWPAFFQHFGGALVVAAILGGSADKFLGERLARDAVEAALGSSLPEPLKEELRWIYEQRILVRQTWTIRLDHTAGQDWVVFQANVVRILRNESGQKRDIVFSGGTAETFSEKGEAEITSVGYLKDGVRTLVEPKQAEAGISYGDRDHKISIQPGQTVEWFFSFRKVVPRTGHEYLVHPYPVTEAEVTVDVPKALCATVTYSQREKFSDPTPAASGFLVKPLNGVLLPHQAVVVHWYPTDKVDQRKQEIEKAR